MLLILLSLAPAVPTWADESLFLPSNSVLVLPLPDEAALAALGNPAIADANITGRTLTLTGKAPGKTNIVAASQDGTLLFKADIVVPAAPLDAVHLFRGLSPQAYHCQPACEPVPGVARPERDRRP
jgi:Flp pilus assembly secretin CpaC